MTGRIEPHMPIPLGAWRDKAKCAGIKEPDFFFPTEYTRNSRETEWVRDVRTFCIDCPVAAECLDEAIRNGDNDGMYGGLTPKERREIRRTRRRQPKPITHGTKKGFDAHERRGEKPCDPCRIAKNTDARQQYAKRKASA